MRTTDADRWVKVRVKPHERERFLRAIEVDALGSERDEPGCHRYCLVGCPVDAIHRDGSLETVIADHCIGCGQCAVNCPYGNINMVPVLEKWSDRHGSGPARAVVQRQATTCDLCRDLVEDPARDEVRCVYACPHRAAFRLSGEELLQRLRDDPPELRYARPS